MFILAVSSGFRLERGACRVGAGGSIGGTYVDLLGGATVLAVVIYAVLNVATNALNVVTIGGFARIGCLASTIHLRHDKLPTFCFLG